MRFGKLAAALTTAAGIGLAAWGLVGLAPAGAAGNPERGDALFRTCAACHQIGVGARNDVGPILNNIVGRRVGSRSGYRYSRAMAAAGADGMQWTEQALHAFIEDPRTAMRGNRMAYAGLRDAEQREDLIAYLRTLTFDDPAESKTLK